MKLHILIPSMVMFMCFSCKNNTPIEPTLPRVQAQLEFPEPQIGTQLTFAFTENQKTTPITFIVNQMDSEISFGYQVQNQEKKEGGFTLSKDVFDSANSTSIDLLNLQSLELDQSGLLISKKMYNQLIQSGKMELNLGKGTKEYLFDQNEELLIECNGKPAYIYAIKFLEEQTKEPYWVFKNESFPIIIKGGNDLKIELKKWENIALES